jgi:hypothetical protein
MIGLSPVKTADRPVAEKLSEKLLGGGWLRAWAFLLRRPGAGGDLGLCVPFPRLLVAAL